MKPFRVNRLARQIDFQKKKQKRNHINDVEKQIAIKYLMAPKKK